MFILICGLLLSIASNVECKSDYDYYPKAGGWVKLNKVLATWQEAFLQCHTEGAVLASPITKELRQVMKTIINDNEHFLSYYIGANSKYTPRQYVSIEGIPLANMPISDMYKVLDMQKGQCLSTNGFNIKVVACSQRLPFLCYKKDDGKNLTVCGTYDTEYQIDLNTGSCYKLHRDLLPWIDANSLCVSEGGYLVILNDNKEARLITSMIPDVRLSWVTDRNWETLYVGIQDWTDNGLYLTNRADSLDNLYNGWYPDQPDKGEQHCGGITRSTKMDNIWCADKASYFVCEKDPQNIRFSTKEEPEDTKEELK